MPTFTLTSACNSNQSKLTVHYLVALIGPFSAMQLRRHLPVPLRYSYSLTVKYISLVCHLRNHNTVQSVHTLENKQTKQFLLGFFNWVLLAPPHNVIMNIFFICNYKERRRKLQQVRRTDDFTKFKIS